MTPTKEMVDMATEHLIHHGMKSVMYKHSSLPYLIASFALMYHNAQLAKCPDELIKGEQNCTGPRDYIKQMFPELKKELECHQLRNKVEIAMRMYTKHRFNSLKILEDV